MDNDSKIPDGWAMPDDMAKKITEGLEKKRITPKDELADALGEEARDVASIETDPRAWGG